MTQKVFDAVERIVGTKDIDINVIPVAQDKHLADNQKNGIRCGDNGIFKGVPLTDEEKRLSKIARTIYDCYGCDGKYILDKDRLIVCQSNASNGDIQYLLEHKFGYTDAIINPLGEWTGGIDVDSGATNRKLGSDMAQSVTGGGLCLSGDSEYLSDDYKWHKISEYHGGKVAEWDNGRLNFVDPLKYIHNKEDDLIYIHNNSKLSMCLTPYHEMLIKTSKGNLIKKQANEIADKLYNQVGNSGAIIHNFIYNKPKTTVSAYDDDNEYRLQVAFCADGTILTGQQKWNGRIRVKRQYKKERLRELLKGKEYKESQDGEYSIFYYHFTKKDKSLYNCFKDEDWGILKDEIFNWDGDSSKKLFRTTIKSEADFIQFVLQSFGMTSGILTMSTAGRTKVLNGKEYIQNSTLYVVNVYKSNQTNLRKSKGVPISVEYLPIKQDSYCFTTPSHNLIIRHNNKIFITGNCGKDLSKADVSVNIYCFMEAQRTGKVVEGFCAIGDTNVTIYIHDKNRKRKKLVPYAEIVKFARTYIESIGGFEKFAEWGLF